MVYRNLSGSDTTHLRVISDAAYKKEEDMGHALRGSIYLRAQGSTLETFHADGTAHILEYLC